MRYRASVSIRYTASGGAGYPVSARESLSAAIATELAARHPAMVTDLQVTVRSGPVVVIDAALRGTAPHELSSPLDALSRLDAGVLRALMVTGQFEEFDVVRRELAAQPTPGH